MNIETLIPDIHGLFNPEYKHSISPDNLDILLASIKDALVNALESEEKSRDDSLRLSKIGTPDRKLWYEFNVKSEENTSGLFTEGEKYLRFLQGHLTEALLLFLAREAGHKVEHEQKTVFVGGVEGHLDCVIDGHLTDVKTASQFGYTKFSSPDKLVSGDDPFGYVQQISAYKKGLENEGISVADPCYIWAYNKSNSAMCLTHIDDFHIIDAEKKIATQKRIVNEVQDVQELPYCYPDEPHGKSGNMMISKNCSYCPFRELCRGDNVRKFEYSTGEVWLTEIKSEPKVKELD